MEFYNRVFQGVRERQFVHPKLEKLKEYLLDHFRRNNAAGRDTRVIVFAEYRSSVQEILNYLRGAELIRATAFVGQQKKSTDILRLNEDGEAVADGSLLYDARDAPPPKKTISSFFAPTDAAATAVSGGSGASASGGGASASGGGASASGGTTAGNTGTGLAMVQVNGQSQKQQQQILQEFKAGKYNVLVATCIAEEGLDIGEVDLLICYEGISSPTRLLQRKGRTGRKRTGRVVILLTEGSEYQKHKRSIQKYNKVSELLKSRASALRLCPDLCTLFQASFRPVCVQESLDIREYHYSQIGGHTPKKRRGAAREKDLEDAFCRSDRGARICRRAGELADGVVVMSEGWDAPTAVWQCAHSAATLAVSELHRALEDGSLVRVYSAGATRRWVEEGRSQASQRREWVLSTDSESEAEPVGLLRGLLARGDEAAELEDDFGSQREPWAWRGAVRHRRRPAMSVLDMVEKQADELLKKLSASRPLRSVSGQSALQPTPSAAQSVQPSVQPTSSVVQPTSSVVQPASSVVQPAVQPAAREAESQEEARVVDLLSESEESEDRPILPAGEARTLPPVALDAVLAEDSTDSEDSPICLPSLAPSLLAAPSQPPHSQPAPAQPVPAQPAPPAQQPPQPPQSPPRQPSRQPPQAAESASTSSTEEEDEPIALLSASLKRPRLTPPEPSKSTSSSSLLIPCLASSLSVVDTTISNAHSNVGDAPTLKPPPLSKEAIDALFPRDDEVLPKRARVAPSTEVSCPLCGHGCASAELLRDHLNFECSCLPPMVSDEEKDAISRLLDSPEPPAAPPPQSTSLPPTTLPPSTLPPTPLPPTPLPPTTLPPSTLPPTTLPPTPLPPTPLPPTPLPPSSLPPTTLPPTTLSPSALPQTAGTTESSFGINSEEIDSLLRLELEAAPATCTICRDASADAANPLLRCAHCGVCVHASCYGLPAAPTGRWQCDVAITNGCEA